MLCVIVDPHRLGHGHAALHRRDEVELARAVGFGNRRSRVHAQQKLLVLARVGQCEEELLLRRAATDRSEEHTSELPSLMRISYAVFCLKKKKNQYRTENRNNPE